MKRITHIDDKGLIWRKITVEDPAPALGCLANVVIVVMLLFSLYSIALLFSCSGTLETSDQLRCNESRR